MNKDIFTWIIIILVIIGAINWGLIAFFDFDLVKAIIPDANLQRFIYGLVGIAGFVMAYQKFMVFQGNQGNRGLPFKTY